MKRAKGSPWTNEQITELKRIYADTPNDKIAEVFGTSVASIAGKARDLGIVKSESFMNSEASGRRRKGQTPWNKGLSYMPRNEEYRYQKGHTPHTWLPIGTIRKNGTRPNEWVIKVTDDEKRNRRWRPYAEYVWVISGNEPPTNNEVIRFKDNFIASSHKCYRVDRLEKISRAENMLLNTVQRYPEDLRLAIHALGILNRSLNKWEKSISVEDGRKKMTTT